MAIRAHSRRGFTLIETMVVVAITLFLSGILLTYNRSTDNQVVLAAEQARVAGVLYRARSFALQKNILKGDISACGFGVHFEKPGRVILFEDIPSDPDDCRTNNATYETEEFLEEVLLNTRVTLISFDSPDVFFESPYLTTTPPETIITLALVGSETATREVRVGAGGEVSTP